MDIINIDVPVFSGKTRKIFIHPDDRNIFIKVALRPNWHLGSLLEIFEYYRIKTTGCNLADQISRIDGIVLTNKGYGLLVERIHDFDGSTSITLRDFINKGVSAAHKQSIVLKLQNLIKLFNDANAIFQDAHPRNVVLRFDEVGDFNIIVVDGFVGRGDFKNFLRQKSPFLLRMKNRHSEKKLIKSLSRIDYENK